MIEGKSVIAIITARAGSKGLPNKNKKLLLGKPLLLYPIEAALKSSFVDECFLSTDDTEMQKIGLGAGAKCPDLRPSELSADNSTSIAVVEHVIDLYKNNGVVFDYILLLEPTSPLTESYDIDQALTILNKNRSKADSIVGVSKVESQHPNFLNKINKIGLLEPHQNKFGSERRQDLDELYHFDGSLYISDTTSFINKKTFYHSRTIGFKMPKWKSFEIDDIVDFYVVESILKNLNKIK